MSSENLGREDVENPKQKQNRLVHDNLASYVLSEPTKLAGPDFLCIVIDDDIVAGGE